MRSFRLNVIQGRFYTLFDKDLHSDSSGLLPSGSPAGIFAFHRYSKKHGVLLLSSEDVYQRDLEDLKGYAPLQEVVQVDPIVIYGCDGTLYADVDEMVDMDELRGQVKQEEPFTGSLYEVLNLIYEKGWCRDA